MLHRPGVAPAGAAAPSFASLALAVLATALAAAPAPVAAQRYHDAALAHRAPESARADTIVATRTFFTRRDLISTGAALLGTAALTRVDTRIARWTQRPDVQGGSSRHRVVQDLSNFSGATTLTWAAVLGYGIGRLAHDSTTAAVSLHLVEAQALTSVMGQAVRGVLGRARPSVNVDEPYALHWGQGFTKFAYRAFPSLHSAAGFVVAAGLVQEMRERKSAATPYAAPLLYGFALVPGVTRMYLNQHWASDVAAGAFLGTLIGSRVVDYAHTQRRTKLDRWLLGATVVPTGGGGALVAVSLP